jgi:hypothetical protein
MLEENFSCISTLKNLVTYRETKEAVIRKRTESVFPSLMPFEFQLCKYSLETRFFYDFIFSFVY